MKRPYYIFSSGKLIRRQNTVFFVPASDQHSQAPDENEEEILIDSTHEDDHEDDTEKYSMRDKRVIPIEDIDSFYLFGETTINMRFLNFLTKYTIPAHVFNYYGYYAGTYYPREYLNSGYLLVQQVGHYTNKEKRLCIAQKFIEAASFNILKNLRYYNNRDADVQAQIDTIAQLREEIMNAYDIPSLMGIEGNIRSCYYSAFPLILNEQFDFQKRVKHPPDNAVNAMISFGNSMVYTLCLSEIYRTQLSPLISFLHEPGTNRFSLALDIAEIFKPIFADRIIFKLLNQKQIQPDDFEKGFNYCLLKEKGRKTFVQEFDAKMQTTIQHRKLNKSVSYRRLVRLECYKLVKHICGDEEYEPFMCWW